MLIDHFADDPRTNLERMLAGDLYIADDPEIARRQQRAMRLAARYQAAYIGDADSARPLLAELLGSVGRASTYGRRSPSITAATSPSGPTHSSTST